MIFGVSAFSSVRQLSVPWSLICAVPVLVVGTKKAEDALEMSMVRLEMNQLDDAYRDAAEAAELSSEAGGQYFLAKATAVLGKVALARRRSGQARQHFHDAIEVFIELGMSAEADN